MNEQSLIRKAMSALGKRKSEAKTKAARANAKKPRGKRKTTLATEQKNRPAL